MRVRAGEGLLLLLKRDENCGRWKDREQVRG